MTDNTQAEALAALIERFRGLHIDHKPDGWPAVRTREITALLDRIAELEAQLAAIGAGGVSALMGAAKAGSEPVATVFTMEALTPGGGVKYHATIHKPLPAGTKLYAAPQPALPAGWVSVKDRLPPPFDEVWVHPRPSDYCCEASVDTVGNWKYSEYETNFGMNHIKCTVEYWMQPPALPVEPSMDGESNG